MRPFRDYNTLLSFAVITFSLGLTHTCFAQHEPTADEAHFDRSTALQTSQAAIGNRVSNFNFTGSQGQPVQLHQYSGKPLVISLIYTSCFHICPTITQHLDITAKKGRDVLGDESFNILTIGFDTANDTADAMRIFAKQQSVTNKNWEFVSTDAATIEALSKQIGFLYFPSPHGFDHLVQTTILDEANVVYRQVYGLDYETPHLVEPLKELVYGNKKDASLLTQINNRIRLFCTVYDPASGRYHFDYSIFMGLLVGLSLGGFMIYWLAKEWRSRFINNPKN